MSGKLIVFEGTDGSGKATQTALLCRELESRGVPFRKLEFPRYKEESSALLRLYLSGAFGTDPADVNAYAAATFFSVDRYASFKQDWGSWYRQGGTGHRRPVHHQQRRAPDLQAAASGAAGVSGLAV